MAVSKDSGTFPPNLPASHRKYLTVAKRANGTVVVSKRPRRRGPAKSGGAYRLQLMMAWCAYWAPRLDGVMLQTCRYLAEGTAYTWRDVAMMMMLGTYYGIEMPDGTQLLSWRIAVNDIQFLLDTISDVEGAVIYRGPVGWVALPPGTNGQVLALSGGLPTWQDETGGGGGSSPDFNIPLATDFTTLVNAPTLTDSVRGLGLEYGGANNTMAMALQDFDNTVNHTWLARFIKWEDMYDNNGMYLVARDSTSGHILGAGNTGNNVSQGYIEGTQWSSDSGYVGGYGGGSARLGPLWVKLEWDSATSTLTASTSQDGVNWDQMFADNSYLANPDQVGIGMSRRSTSYHSRGSVTFYS